MSTRESPLGARIPKDDNHIQLWPVRAAMAPETLTGQPVVFGIPWFAAFDDPEEIHIRGRQHPVYFIGRQKLWGPIRGWHAIAAADPRVVRDSKLWQKHYDQRPFGGACTGFSAARFKTWFDRIRYDAAALYHRAQEIDEWDDTPPEGGSSVRAAFDVMRTEGLARFYANKSYPPDLKHGIAVNRWLLTPDEILAVLGTADYMGGVVPFFQSWGLTYPHIVYLPANKLPYLMIEGSDCTTATDR